MTQEALLPASIVDQVREVFAQLKHPVEMILFTSAGNEYAAEATQLLTEVAAISDKLTFVSYDIAENADLAKHYRIDKTLAIILAARDGDQLTDYGIRFLGIPSGHEFTTLIQDILLVSGRDSGLSDATRAYIKNLEKPLHLQVFVTPT